MLHTRAQSKAKYAERGWPCSEYSIARFNDRIANRDDPDVQAIEGWRKWPASVAECTSIGDSNPHASVLPSACPRILCFRPRLFKRPMAAPVAHRQADDVGEAWDRL